MRQSESGSINIINLGAKSGSGGEKVVAISASSPRPYGVRQDLIQPVLRQLQFKEYPHLAAGEIIDKFRRAFEVGLG